jgi:mono/diheme cytochrome c family protein
MTARRPACAFFLAASLVVGTGAACRRQATPVTEPLAAAFHAETLSPRQARGERLFRERCAVCHGERGQADSSNSYNLTPQPPDFSQSLAARPESERRLIIEQGSAAAGRSPLCPPAGRTLTRNEIDALLAYLRVLEQPQKVEPQTKVRRRRQR